MEQIEVLLVTMMEEIKTSNKLLKEILEVVKSK